MRASPVDLLRNCPDPQAMENQMVVDWRDFGNHLFPLQSGTNQVYREERTDGFAGVNGAGTEAVNDSIGADKDEVLTPWVGHILLTGEYRRPERPIPDLAALAYDPAPTGIDPLYAAP